MKNKTKNLTAVLTQQMALTYAVGILGLQLLIGTVNSFQAEFYNKMYSSFDANIFYASAIIIFIAKIISCIADPIIGSLIDKSNLKGGKMRPWILRSAFPIAILTTIIFIYIPFDNFQNGKILLYAYITITTVLWNMSMSFADIPSSGMLSLLSPVEEERNNAAGLSNIMKQIGALAPGFVVTAVMLVLNAVKGEGNYEDKTYYLLTALVMFVICLPCYLLNYTKTRERVESSGKSNNVSFKEMFSELKTNKLILIVFLINMLGFARNIIQIVCVQANGALIGKVTLFGSEMDPTSGATWLPRIFGLVASFVLIAFLPKFHAKFGEKKMYIFFSVAAFIVGMGCTVFYWLLPEGSPLRYGQSALVMIMIMQTIVPCFNIANTYVPLVMTANIVEYLAKKTGNGKEGVNYAILSMSIKLSNAICVVTGLLIIAASGYTQVAYETGAITVKMQNIVMFAYSGAGAISALLSVIPMLFYKLDKNEK